MPDTASQTSWEKMARTLVFQHMLQHPLPWRVEYDWTCEARASDGYTVAKCHDREEAESIIRLAESINAELKQIEPCDECGELATWVRRTQFAGDHFLCQTHAEAEENFGKTDSSYFVWEKLTDKS